MARLIWKVVRDGEQVILDDQQLANLLLANISGKEEKQDVGSLATKLVGQLQMNGLLGEMNPYEIAYLAAMLGYYYRIFLQNNKVELEFENESNNNEPGR